MYSIEMIHKDLRGLLSNFRYEHSVRVAEEARKLANYYHYDAEKAYVAGLVHDIAKEFDQTENQKWIEKYHLDKKWLSFDCSNIIHAEVGALVISEWYGLDEEICNAVRYHTVGHVPMSLLEKIIFVADKIEPGKKYVGIELERKMAYQNLDQALVLCLQNQKKKLESAGKNIYPESEELLKFLLSQVS